MTRVATKTVQFTERNVEKCQCGRCPVPTGSACFKDQQQQMRESPGAMMSDPKQTPRVYCSAGTSTCGDFDAKQQCICPTCDVWQENDLANYKYCVNGSAQQIG